MLSAFGEGCTVAVDRSGYSAPVPTESPLIAPCSSTWGDAGTQKKGDRLPLVAHAEEQAALRRIIGLREQGRGARKIAAALNEQGANPRSGKPWTPENVATILRRLERWEAAGVDALAA
jgi:hypothetical protein